MIIIIYIFYLTLYLMYIVVLLPIESKCNCFNINIIHLYINRLYIDYNMLISPIQYAQCTLLCSITMNYSLNNCFNITFQKLEPIFLFDIIQIYTLIYSNILCSSLSFKCIVSDVIR